MFAPALVTVAYGFAMSLSLTSRPPNGNGGDSDSTAHPTILVDNGEQTPQRHRRAKRGMVRAPVSVSDVLSNVAPTPAKSKCPKQVPPKLSTKKKKEYCAATPFVLPKRSLMVMVMVMVTLMMMQI